MLKLYADLFALTEESISAKSINRLRWLTIGSLPILPIVAFMKTFGLKSLRVFGPSSLYLAVLVLTIFVVSLICAVPVLFSRIGNRIWAPDKYLDEWERDMKRKSMAMAFIVVMWVTGAIGVSLNFAGKLIGPYISDNPTILPFLIILTVLGTGIYTLIFTQLSLIEPIDKDELEGPKYIVTTARSIVGIIALFLAIISFIGMLFGFFYEHGQHNDAHHSAAKEVCGDAGIDGHIETDTAVEVTCEGSELVIRLNLDTLEPI